MTATSSLRIHPAIGLARVGTSEDYYLGPETMAGMPQPGGKVTGGLPIKKGTENTPITSADLRDGEGKLKRQAARFHIFQYPYQESGPTSYPCGGGTEVVIGSQVDGKKVVDIVWTVHLANKKANCWIDEGLDSFEGQSRPPIRNLQFPPSQNPADVNRLKKLIIDAGPRAICCNGSVAPFNKTTQASYWDDAVGKVVKQPNYPISFPASDGEGKGDVPVPSQSITYLGEITTEKNGRLLVLGGHGKACAFDKHGNFSSDIPLKHDVNNDNWLDDTADGPVTAVLIFDDGSRKAVPGSAWVVATDPGYAPQITNAVTQWDDIYTTWLEHFSLQPEIFKDGKYVDSYKPDFNDKVLPILRTAAQQMWTTNLPPHAVNQHRKIDQLPESGPGFDLMSFIRKPEGEDEHGAPLMPLSLGDIDKSFISFSRAQHFFLEQWSKGKCVGAQPIRLGSGEFLDKAVLFNCLGGRYSPGIDMTYIVRDVNLYNKEWNNPSIGPFRINAEQLDYTRAQKETPFLGVGYIPLQEYPVQPGDICKFMALPWHTDYNSCATHTPSPNPGGKITGDNQTSGINTTLFWSWPAQRPVAVYTFEDLARAHGSLPGQRFSVRGNGTKSEDPSGVGRFQKREDFILNWHKIGTVIQGPAIDGYDPAYPENYYLEVESQFEKDESNLVGPWPNKTTDKTYPPND